MLEDPSNNPTEGAALSWQERELVNALKRLANARSQLSALEEQSRSGSRSIDQADIDALRETRYELAQARQKGKARFGGGSARERSERLELDERLILERMGFATYEEFEHWRTQPQQASIDPVIVEFARHELADAEAAWYEIQALEIPPQDPEPDSEDEGDSGQGTLERGSQGLPFTRPAAS